jgi:hypothetical protein
MTKNINKWDNYTYPLNNRIVTNDNITLALNSFKDKIENIIALSDKLRALLCNKQNNSRM